MKIASVFGARPQFIKVALLSRQFDSDGVQHLVINTGQHYDALMADVFLQDLGMRAPDYDLEVGSASHAQQTALILDRVEEVLFREKPDAVIVYGDTNSTIGGALAAAKCQIPIAHVEAGLRSFNRRMPEEINRIVADHLADLHLVPGRAAADQLMREGVAKSKVSIVGDILYDSILAHLESVNRSDVLERLGLKAGEYVLCTVHRAENVDDPVRRMRIFESLARVAKVLPVVFPVHPRSRKAIEASAEDAALLRQVQLIDPVGHLDMLALEKNAAVIATDSGGVQREAFYLDRPCVVLRNETEWTELVASGWNTLAPPDGSSDLSGSILSAVGKPGMPGVKPYGDGHAAAKISSAVQDLCLKNSTSLEAISS